MAPVPTPHAAARPRNLSWAPCTASSCCCQVQSVSWGVPVRPPIDAVSIATLCHVPLSGLLTLLVVSIFVIGCCMASHWLLPPPPPLWLHTLVLAP
ncbi:unnamed protein product [Staurois parvus]|uniref:Uncharacterized protein n=1 Tax=Staurois parvus TaxID=386267 RepID=A0ABN9BBK3_9NEOB|nr:unnamed protein product [Staurois parvus]